MSRCTECNDHPEGTVCAYALCPGKRRSIAPSIPDTGEEWPFHMARTPYRPDSFDDWRDGILEGLGSSAVEQAGLFFSFHESGHNA